MRFLIPTRFLKFPIFTYLLKIAKEEYEFKISGGIALPWEVDFFKKVLRFLEERWEDYGGLELHEFLKLIREVGFEVGFHFMQRKWPFLVRIVCRSCIELGFSCFFIFYHRFIIWTQKWMKNRDQFVIYFCFSIFFFLDETKCLR